MNEREQMKLAETLEEFSMSDYTVEELEKMRGGQTYYKYKQKYFEYYDDVKDKTLKKQDW